MYGKLTVIFGSMFSEKSGELIHECEMTQLYRKKNVICFKPVIDNRWGKNSIKSRTGGSFQAKDLNIDLSEVSYELYEKGTINGITVTDYYLIGFDEVQFFNENIIQIINFLLSKGINVMVAGLNLTADAKLFGHTAELAMMADKIIHKHAICARCGEEAIFSHKKIKNDKVIDIGDGEYEPLCRKCYCEINNKIKEK